MSLITNAFMSLISYHVCVRLIPSMKERFIKADMAGKDLNKPSEERKLMYECSYSNSLMHNVGHVRHNTV